jgi:hypothetical protein
MRAIVFALIFAVIGGFAIACSSSSSGTDTEACEYDAGNDPQCPQAFSTSLNGEPCPADGLTCEYPGIGTATDSYGCHVPATLFCTQATASDDGAISDDDGGDDDASTTTWVSAN